MRIRQAIALAGALMALGAIPATAPAALSILDDADAPVRQIVQPSDGSVGIDGPRGALRQEPSVGHLFGGAADARFRIGRVEAASLVTLPAKTIAARLRNQIDRGCVIGGRNYGCSSRMVVVYGVDARFADRGTLGARFTAAMKLLQRPAPGGGTYAGRVHVMLAPSAIRQIAVGRGLDQNLDRAGKPTLPRWRTVMPGLARTGGVWLQMYPHDRRATPLSAGEWSTSLRDVTSLYLRAGGRTERLHVMFTRATKRPAGAPNSCATAMACQWALADRGIGARILRNGAGAYRVGAQAAEWRRQYNLRMPAVTPPTVPPTAPPAVQLTVGVSGHGSVSSSPAGIACGTDCVETYAAGTAVTLTAQPVSGHTFTGWSGACTGQGACVVTMDRAQSVTASFAAGPPQLRVHRRGAGSGTVTSSLPGIACGTDCDGTFPVGTLVTLTATPATGSSHVGWMGAGCSATGPCVVDVRSATEVIALFAPTSPASAAACTVTRSTATTPTIPAAHPRILFSNASTTACLQQLLTDQAPSAVRFRSLVDQQLASGNVYAYQAWYSALMYRVTGDVDYANHAVTTVESFVASEEALIAAGQRPTVSYDSYLEVGDHLANVMLVYDWCYDLLTPSQRARWVGYADQAVWNVWNHQSASWGGNPFPWSGWSVDNPSNNYYYSFLRATMMLGLGAHGEHARAAQWVDQFRTTKLENQLFPLFNANLTGGGSREGTGYGTAMRSLFQLYDWWERSTGERIADRAPHTLASTAHLMHNIVPTLDRLAPTGDHARDETAALFDYHRDYLLSLMALYPDHELTGVARSLLAASSVPQMANRFMFWADYLYNPPAGPSVPLSRLSTAYWGAGTGQLLMRSSWTDPGATWAGFICGPYDESHAHRDQGSFTLYRGSWLAWDANMASHSGIEQGEELHNLVRIEHNGTTVTQVEGAPRCQLRALASNDHFTYGVADVTPVYNGKPQVAKVEREFLYLRPDVVVVFDRVATSGAGIRRVWTLNSPTTPLVGSDRVSIANGGHQLDVFPVAPAGLIPTVVGGTRVEIADSAGDRSRFLNVLGTDGAVRSVSPANDAGRTGVQVLLADGRQVVVRFSDDASGGTLRIVDAGGNVVQDGALPTSVVAPPLFRAG